ncbi:hypothetical protein BCR43DRAFT_559952 [Syncephalastrum racemosum]|uniref:CST complex subunit CTC1 n=1 Tax=Syncephalastrum racemosum TaxID=13706 RepID=A0A1X2HUF8_SYNRA|nr:hypothetical protein BCR43DRAFT_559952 [Syncephalastrum racemosum]
MDHLFPASLCSRASAISFEELPQPLTGKVEILLNGDIILHDRLTAGASIKCRPTRFDSHLHNQTIVVSVWSYVKYNDHYWLEFDLKDCRNTTGAACSDIISKEQTLLVDHIMNRKETLDLLLDMSQLRQYTQSTSALTLVGCVWAKSVMMSDAKGHYFMLQVELPDENTITIRVGDGETRRYHDYLLGCHFIFSRLSYTSKYYIFSTASDSTLLNYAQYKHLVNPYAPSTYDASYTGIVTRILDPYMGFYILDDQFLLCLTYCMQYKDNEPLRLETRVRVHNPHFVTVTSPRVSHLLDRHWQVPREKKEHSVLFACGQSHIEYLSFPVSIHQTPDGPRNSHLYAVYKSALQELHPGPTLLRRLELAAALKVKLSDFLRGAIRPTYVDDGDAAIFTTRESQLVLMLEKSIHTKASVPLRRSEVKNSFRLHDDTTCPAVASTYRDTIQFDEFPSLSELTCLPVKQISQSREFLVGLHMNLVNVDMHIQEVSKEVGLVHCAAVGVVDLDRNGELFFGDDTRQWRLLIDADESYPFRPETGAVYLIKQFWIVEEDLGYERSGGNVDLKVHYIVCRPNDLEHIYQYRVPEESIQLPTSPNRWRLQGFSSDQPGEKGLALLYVLDISHKHLHATHAGHLTLAVDIKAVLYPVLSEDARLPPMQEPLRAVIQISSENGGLAHLPHMAAGAWLGLQGLQSYPTSRPVRPLKGIRSLPEDRSRNKVNYHIRPAPLLIEFDEALHTFIPVNPRFKGHAISLQPILSKKELPSVPNIVLNGPIHPVKHLVSSHMDNIIDWERLNDGTYKELVNVEGILVAKEFRSSFEELPIDLVDELYTSTGIGTRHPSRTLFLRLRETSGLNTIDIYVRMLRRPYPLGLLLGSRVTFYNLARRRAGNANRFYCFAEEYTQIEVRPRLKDFKDTVDLGQYEQKSFQDLYDILASDNPSALAVTRTPCLVQEVGLIRCSWKCLKCGTTVGSNGKCYGICRDEAQFKFLTECMVVLSDGTAEALAMVDEERMIWQLLGLSNEAIQRIKLSALETGALEYGFLPNQVTGSQLFLDACRRLARRSTRWMVYGHPIPHKSQIKSQTLMSRLGLRSRKLDESALTASHIRLRFKLMFLEHLDMMDTLLSELNKSLNV